VQAEDPSSPVAAARSPGQRLFVSYTASDRGWAEWIAWQLEAVGYRVELQAWDFHPGQHFIERMNQAASADRVVAVLSDTYLASPYASEEWWAALLRGHGEPVRLLPVRVAACTLPPLLAGRIYVDLVGVDEAEAARRLRQGAAASVKGTRGKPAVAPAFPGGPDVPAAGTQPPFPGSGPAISNLPPRNLHFTGRATLLEALEEQLKVGVAALVAAHGLGGVGKTQLALEYAHRHAHQYELVWWVAADMASPIVTGVGELAPRLGLAVEADLEATAARVVEALGRRSGWLLVFDNAEDPSQVDRFLPAGSGGHVLVTSRNPAFGQLGTKIEVAVLPAEEAVAFLLARSGDSDQVAARELAGELGGLPLALAQAAAYCEQTSLDLAGYLARYRSRRRELLARGALAGYPETVATTWRLNLEQVQLGTPAAVDLLRLCAFLAPAIPLELLTAAPAVLPTALARVVADELATDELVAALHRFSLVRRGRSGLAVHRLVQAVVRDSLNREQASMWAGRAVRLVLAALPEDPEDPGGWPRYAALLAHAQTAAGHAHARAVGADATATLLYRVGAYLWSRVELPAARAALKQALAIISPVNGPHHPSVAAAVHMLGLVQRDLGDLTGARQRLEVALAINQAAYGPNHPEVANTLGDLGGVLEELGDLAGAHRHQERSLAMLEAAYGANHPHVAIAVGSLGNLLRKRGDLAGARRFRERALAITQAAFGPDHPRVALSLGNLGLVLEELGDLAGAHACHVRALAINEAAFGPDHPRVALTLNNVANIVGLARGELGELTSARQHLERALAINQAAYGPDHPEVGLTLTTLGLNVLPNLGEQLEARRCLERALAINQAAYGPGHHQVALTLMGLGGVLAELGELAEARRCLERALAINLATYGPDHLYVANTLATLGLVLAEFGELTDARHHLERALGIASGAVGAAHHLTRDIERGLDRLRELADHEAQPEHSRPTND
jgi:tetratricopeptide (TPR) repeat protein